LGFVVVLTQFPNPSVHCPFSFKAFCVEPSESTDNGFFAQAALARRNFRRLGKASDPDDGVVPYVEEGKSKL